MSKKEIEYYNEIAVQFVEFFTANLDQPEKYRVRPLMGEISSSLRTLIVNGHPTNELLNTFSREVHKLHLDISLLIENKETQKFELVILEVKKVKNLGLQQLSQLIGYCLVSKSKFGILLNINKGVSSEFGVILDSDENLTRIDRLIDDKLITHKFGVMVYNSNTKKFDYLNTGTLKTIPDLVKEVISEIS